MINLIAAIFLLAAPVSAQVIKQSGIGGQVTVTTVTAGNITATSLTVPGGFVATSTGTGTPQVTTTLNPGVILRGNGSNVTQVRYVSQDGATIEGYTDVSPGEMRHYSATGVQTFYANGIEAARIDTSGRLGIGTASPNDRLQVNGPNSNTGQEFGNTAGGAAYIQSYDRVAAAYREYQIRAASTTIMYNGGSSPALAVAVSGNVGIGTTSPATTLDVNGSAQFGSGVHKATATASGYFIAPYWTHAQIVAATPATAELGGQVTCMDCASPYSICVATGTTVQGFRLGSSGSSECK